MPFFPSVSLSVHPLRTISQEPHIIWSSFLVHMCKMMISPATFFSFFKFWFFGLLSGVKSQKMAQNNKKFSLSHSVSQELYQFLVHIRKMMLSPAIFFSFSKFWFFRFLGSRGVVKGETMTHNDHFQSVTLYISGIVDHNIKIFGTQVNSCSSSSSINTKQKFWSCSHLLHMCVIFSVCRLSGWAKSLYIWKQ